MTQSKRRRIDRNRAIMELAESFAAWEHFDLENVRTVGGYSKSSAARLLAKGLSDGRFEAIGRQGRKKRYRVIQNPPPLRSAVVAAAEGRHRQGDPIAALQRVIGAHDPGPTREGLERALSILQSLSAIAPRSR